MLTRRDFLKALGIGAAAAVIEEPIRKLWFVPSTAPVGSRIEHLEGYGDDLEVSGPGAFELDKRVRFRDWALKLELRDEDLCDSRFDELLRAARHQKRAMYAQQDRDFAEMLAADPLSRDHADALEYMYGGARGGGKSARWADEAQRALAQRALAQRALAQPTWRIASIEQAENMAKSFVTVVSGVPDIQVAFGNDLKFSKG